MPYTRSLFVFIQDTVIPKPFKNKPGHHPLYPMMYLNDMQSREKQAVKKKQMKQVTKELKLLLAKTTVTRASTEEIMSVMVLLSNNKRRSPQQLMQQQQLLHLLGFKSKTKGK